MASSSDPTGPVAPPGIFPAPPGITPDYIHPEVRSFGFVPLSAVFTTLSTFSLALRLYTKGRIIRLLGWDDAVITLAWGTVVTLVGLFGKGLKLGSGAHIWNLRLDNLEEYTKTLVSAVVLSNLASNLPRIAILLFYLRINPAKSFRYGTFAVIWMTTASMLIYVCIILFQCHPVKKLWFPLTPGTCLVLNPVYLSIPIVSVTLDLLILALPIPMVYHLQVSRRTKLLLMGIFALSGCTIVTGIMRLWQTAALQVREFNRLRPWIECETLTIQPSMLGNGRYDLDHDAVNFTVNCRIQSFHYLCLPHGATPFLPTPPSNPLGD